MRLLTPSCYASVLRLCATSLVLRLYSLLDDYFARDPLAVDDQLVDVHAGPRQLPGILHVASPDSSVRTTPRIAQAYGFIYPSSSRTRRDLGRLSSLLSDTRVSTVPIQTYEPPFPAVNLASTRASPARRVTPRRSAHSSSGIKYLRVSPRRSRNTAGVAGPSSTSAASRAVRNSASAPFAA